MINVTRYDGKEITMNAELIQFVESAPDTIITLTNGQKIIVKDSLDEVNSKVIEYKRRIYRCEQ